MKKSKRYFKKLIRTTITLISDYLYDYSYKVINRPGHPGGSLSKFEIRARVEYYLLLFKIIIYSLIIILIISLINIIL